MVAPKNLASAVYRMEFIFGTWTRGRAVTPWYVSSDLYHCRLCRVENLSTCGGSRQARCDERQSASKVSAQRGNSEVNRDVCRDRRFMGRNLLHHPLLPGIEESLDGRRPSAGWNPAWTADCDQIDVHRFDGRSPGVRGRGRHDRNGMRDPQRDPRDHRRMRRRLRLCNVPRLCRRGISGGVRSALRERGRHAGLRLQRPAELAPLLPNQDYPCARRHQRHHAEPARLAENSGKLARFLLRSRRESSYRIDEQEPRQRDPVSPTEITGEMGPRGALDAKALEPECMTGNNPRLTEGLFLCREAWRRFRESNIASLLGCVILGISEGSRSSDHMFRGVSSGHWFPPSRITFWDFGARLNE
jgi:hypothetical protein